jgi:hypothetical protein
MQQMEDVPMHRTTVMLPPELKRRAERKSRELGVSFGEFVRRSLRDELVSEEGSGKDSLFEDTGVYRGEAPPDAAVRHDEHLCGGHGD